MDTLRVEDFEFDAALTVKAKVAHWKKKKLWFYTVKPSETSKGMYTAHDDKGRHIALTNGSPMQFKTEEDALRHALQYNVDAIKIRQASCRVWLRSGNKKTYTNI